jgi:amino acid transporter
MGSLRGPHDELAVQHSFLPPSGTADSVSTTGVQFRHSLRPLDVPVMILAVMISLDMVGQISTFGGESVTWLLVLALLWMIPYGLVTAELGSAFPVEGGLYEWVKQAFGRLSGSLAAIMYWSINPLWIGGSLTFLSTEAWSTYIHPIEAGTVADYVFKGAFVLASTAITLLSMERCRLIFEIGTNAKLLLALFFLTTTVVYGIENGFNGVSILTWSPTMTGFLALVPLLLFSLVGFEVPSQAGEEMQTPQRDVPRGIAVGGFVGLLAYVLPILALLLVLPPDKITGIAGFTATVDKVLGVYGPAARILVKLTVVAFVVTLAISGATWALAANRALAVAAADGAFFPYFAKFDPQRQTPVRVGVLTCVVALVFMIAGVTFSTGDSAATFTVVLSITISTSLIAYLFVFPSALRLRSTHLDTQRPYAVPGGRLGMALVTGITTFWAALGTWVTIFPGTLEALFGLDYPFLDHWGVSRLRFEVFTLGTLAVLTLIAVAGYIQGHSVRSAKLGPAEFDDPVANTPSS